MDSKNLPTGAEISEGLYIMMNKASRTVLGLHDGKLQGGTPCTGQNRKTTASFVDSVWLIRQDGPDRTYTVRNVTSANYMDSCSSSKSDSSLVASWGRSKDPKSLGHLKQGWKIQVEAAGFYTLQNAHTETFLAIKAGSTTPGTPVVSSPFDQDDDARLWELERVSRTADEILSILGKWDESFLARLCLPHNGDAQYFVLPHLIRTSIWENTNLRLQPLRHLVFDYEDFVIKTKDAATTWVRDTLKIDGYSALFGLVYGNASKGPKGYNWYLSPDLYSVVFFDAQTGREYTAPALEDAEFKPSFGMF